MSKVWLLHRHTGSDQSVTLIKRWYLELIVLLGVGSVIGNGQKEEVSGAQTTVECRCR